MALMFIKRKRKSPKDESVKFYPAVKTIKQVGRGTVAQLLADETTLNPKEAELALAQLEKVVLRLLLSGHSVKVGEWASFHCTVTAKGAASEKECNSSLIKKVHAHCRFGKDFRDALNKAEFKLVTDLIETKK